MHTPLESYLHQMIQENGPIPFDRFMNEALYHPQWGYYESKQTLIGKGGDFQTSVSNGPVFGELLARQFLDWSVIDSTNQWLECGAHHGQLAEDILETMASMDSKKAQQITYLIFEPSRKRRSIQQERLKRFGSNVSWVSKWDEVKTRFRQGVIFSNELLDAFPTKRFDWDSSSDSWCELCVSGNQGQFQWYLQPTDQKVPETLLSKAEFDQLKTILPNHYTIERSLVAEKWWHKAAKHLERGHLVTIDYGFMDKFEKFAPQRSNGTLRTYSRHRVGDDVLSNPGQVDLTAHVDFPSLKKIGENQGLKTEGLISQEKFMHGCLEKAIIQGMQLSPKQIAQFRTLMYPEHFGKSFKVLVQSKLESQSNLLKPNSK